jgi:thymidylate synthase
MGAAMKQYHELMQRVLNEGVKKEDRTGTGTLSVFGHQMRFNLAEGFPLVTTKKCHTKSIIHELLWFLQGDSNIKYLKDNGVSIWNEWADENGNLGPVYGVQWRSWKTHDGRTIDQIKNLVEMIKKNPDSRRMMVNAYNVGELDTMVLPPCHYGFQVYTRELSEDERNEIRDMQYFKNRLHQSLKGSDTKIDWENIPTRAISLMWNQRSVDTFLGLPFNIASYGLLLTMIADEVNMVPDELIGNLGDTHLYLNHIEQAKEQIGREPYDLPKVSVRDGIFCSSINDVILENYQSHPAIKAPLSN